MKSLILTFTVYVFLAATSPASWGKVLPVDLRCEYRVNPLGIDAAAPRLSWRLEANERAQTQSAYRILVASSPELLKVGKADLWDSGKVASQNSVNTEYKGETLGSRQHCYWKVRVWDGSGKARGWSDVASWSMGLLDRSLWKASCISYRDTAAVFTNRDSLFLPAARQYRKEFGVEKRVKRATLYATALGIYEVYVNGKRVSDAYFAPGWTDYRKRAYYWTYDATSLVKKGSNAIGAWVADGWYSGYIGFGLLTGIGTEKIGRYTYGKTPAWLAQLEIEYDDGSQETVLTDPSWKVNHDGPIREADLLMGEFYDARLENPNWAKAGFDDGGWDHAILAGDNGPAQATFYEWQNPEGTGNSKVVGKPVDLGFKAPRKLEAFPGMPVRITEEIHPVGITSPSNGVYIFNLGQNFAGVVRLKVRGKGGTTIQLRYGEMLHPDGRLMTENLRKARATDHYILRGTGEEEVYQPRFTFHGFQYVEITGFPGKPGKDAITGLVMHSDIPLASAFECSDGTVNRIFKNVVWTQRANFLDLPTDCPQRDERFGWTGDAQIYVRTATYNADVAAFYTKWIRELMESQRPSGVFPGYAPFPFQHGWDFGTAWCDAGVICPHTMYLAYGDTRIIEECWEPMSCFMEWRKANSKDFLGLTHGNHWGDWLAINEPTPLDYIDTAYFAYSSKLMAEMAAAIQKPREAAEYRELFANIKEAFNRKYVGPEGRLNIDTQTAYALALWMDLLPEGMRAQAGRILADKIRAGAGETNSGMRTGFLGTRPLLPVLSASGEHDLALQLLQSQKFPSWGFEVSNGATTIWERWNSYTRENGFGGAQNASMNSFAHYSFGAVCEWMFARLAGIDTQGPAFKHVLIHPMPPSLNGGTTTNPIRWVKAHYDSIQGRVASEWEQEPGMFRLKVEIPANTVSTVLIPARNSFSVTEQGHALEGHRFVRVRRMNSGGFLEMQVPSGTYEFESRTGP